MNDKREILYGSSDDTPEAIAEVKRKSERIIPPEEKALQESYDAMRKNFRLKIEECANLNLQIREEDWISVSDKLPDDDPPDGFALVCITYPGGFRGDVYYNKKDNTWNQPSDGDGGDYEIGGVILWKYLKLPGFKG